jgi:hypothetical protein
MEQDTPRCQSFARKDTSSTKRSSALYEEPGEKYLDGLADKVQNVASMAHFSKVYKAINKLLYKPANPRVPVKDMEY